MNNKDQQIRLCLEEGKSYKQIQTALRVSPCRISFNKRLLEKQERIKNSIIADENDENSSKSSVFGSVGSENDALSADFCRSAGLNGSEIAKIVAFQTEKLQFKREKWLAEKAFDENFLQNRILETKNREKELELQEKEQKLKQDELNFKIREADRPLKLLFYRLQQFVEGKELADQGYDGVVRTLASIQQLRIDYLAQAYADNFTFENTPHARIIDELIKAYEKLRVEMQRDPNRKPDVIFTIELSIIKTNLYGVDYRV